MRLIIAIISITFISLISIESAYAEWLTHCKSANPNDCEKIFRVEYFDDAWCNTQYVAGGDYIYCNHKSKEACVKMREHNIFMSDARCLRNPRKRDDE